MEAEQGSAGGAALAGINMKGTFLIQKKAHDVILHANVLKWRKAGRTDVEYEIVNLGNVLCVTTANHAIDRGSASTSGSTKLLPLLTLHYVVKTPKYVWTHNTLEFYGGSEGGCDINPWVSHIRGHISKLDRPKKLLVFVNPKSGGCKGVQIHDNKVAPLFKLAGIETELTVTQSAQHYREVLSQCNLEALDGVVSIGGDGSFLHCFNGLLHRMASDAGVDLDHITTNPVSPKIPIGLVPAGTGQGMSKYFTNTADPTTATLHIILGERHIIGLHSVYNDGKLLTFGAMLVCYGFLGDFTKFSEKARYLGRSRYAYAIVRGVGARRVFDAEIHYNPVGEDTKRKEVGAAVASGGKEGWRVKKGSFTSIHMFIVDLTQAGLEKKTKQEGFVPSDPRTGALRIYCADSGCSRSKFFKMFIDMVTGDDSSLENNHVVRHDASEYKVVVNVPELNEKTNSLNIDGELYTLKDKTFHVRSHPMILPVFGAGVYKVLGLDKLLETAKQAVVADEAMASGE